MASHSLYATIIGVRKQFANSVEQQYAVIEGLSAGSVNSARSITTDNYAGTLYNNLTLKSQEGNLIKLLDEDDDLTMEGGNITNSVAEDLSLNEAIVGLCDYYTHNPYLSISDLQAVVSNVTNSASPDVRTLADNLTALATDDGRIHVSVFGSYMRSLLSDCKTTAENGGIELDTSAYVYLPTMMHTVFSEVVQVIAVGLLGLISPVLAGVTGIVMYAIGQIKSITDSAGSMEGNPDSITNMFSYPSIAAYGGDVWAYPPDVQPKGVCMYEGVGSTTFTWKRSNGDSCANMYLTANIDPTRALQALKKTVGTGKTFEVLTQTPQAGLASNVPHYICYTLAGELTVYNLQNIFKAAEMTQEERFRATTDLAYARTSMFVALLIQALYSSVARDCTWGYANRVTYQNMSGVNNYFSVENAGTLDDTYRKAYQEFGFNVNAGAIDAMVRELGNSTMPTYGKLRDSCIPWGENESFSALSYLSIAIALWLRNETAGASNAIDMCIDPGQDFFASLFGVAYPTTRTGLRSFDDGVGRMYQWMGTVPGVSAGFEAWPSVPVSPWTGLTPIYYMKVESPTTEDLWRNIHYAFGSQAGFTSGLTGIPMDRCYTLPAYTQDNVKKAARALAVAAGVTAVAIIGGKVIRRRVAKVYQSKSYTKLKSLKEAYEANPTDDNYKRFRKATKSYNRIGGVLGLGSYDMFNGWYNEPKSSGLGLPTVEDQSSEQFSLLYGAITGGTPKL